MTRDELNEGLRRALHRRAIASHDIAVKAIEDLLPVVDAYVAAERERLAQVVEATWPRPDNFADVSPLEAAVWACAQAAARIVRAGGDDS